MDEDDEFELGVEGCRHGLGFDEDCEWCNLDIEEDRRQERIAKQRQRDLIYHADEVSESE